MIRLQVEVVHVILQSLSCARNSPTTLVNPKRPAMSRGPVSCALLCCLFLTTYATAGAPRKIKFPRDVNTTAIREIIEELGFLYESYDVTTEDGYILNLNRMVHPGKAGKRDKGCPLLIVNGLFMQSEAWLIQSRVDSNIAATWTKKGYDVWLGDQRGSMRSLGHVNLTTDQKEYWDFSFHESGIYDLPEFIDFILKKTGRKRIVYSCMSLGCSYHFVLLSQRPEYNEKFVGAIDFVPIGKVPNRHELPMSVQLTFISLDLLVKSYEKNGIIKIHEVDLLKKQSRDLCNRAPFIFVQLIQMFFGPGYNFVQDDICAQIALAFGGSSLKTMNHVLQIYDTGEFAQYNYGREGNLKRYGRELPPLYDFSKITSFVALYYSNRDVYAPTRMVEQMKKEISGPTYGCEMLQFNHLDVATGRSFIDVLPDVNQVLDSISGYSNDTKKAMSGKCPSRIRHVG